METVANNAPEGGDGTTTMDWGNSINLMVKSERMAECTADNSEAMRAGITEETHVVYTLTSANAIESVETEPLTTHQVVFSSRVNCFVLLQLSALNRSRQSLSFGGLGVEPSASQLIGRKRGRLQCYR